MGIQYPVHDLRDHPWYYAFLIIAKHYFYSFFCLRRGCILVPETFFDKSPDSGGTLHFPACADEAPARHRKRAGRYHRGANQPRPAVHGSRQVRIGHPSGVMTMSPEIVEKEGAIEVPSVSVQRTARRIMDGTLYIRK